MALSTTENALRHNTSTPLSCRRSARSSTCSPALIARPWTRRPAGSDRRPDSGAALGCGELTLPLTEGFLGAAAPPVSGDGCGPLGFDATLFAVVWRLVVHHGLGLTVNEHLHLPRQPVRFLHSRDQRCVVAGLVFPHQVGPGAAVDPTHLDTGRCAERDLVLGSGHLDEGLAD